MRNIRNFTKAAVLVFLAGPAWSENLAAVRQALESKYVLTVTTADKRDIVTAGSVLILKKSGLLTVDTSSKNPYQNKYVNGRITQNPLGKTSSWLKHMPVASSLSRSTDRTFVSGEKLWVTGVDITEKAIVFSLYSDAYQDTRYEASLAFPFEKGDELTISRASALVAEVFDIQSPDGDAPSAPARPAGRRPQPTAPRIADEAPPPLAPPPPPPADPKTIQQGQTPDQVTAILGQPDKVIKLATKQIYVYKDMKVVFVGGKVTDVE